eukprot:g2518.t1
MLYDYHPDYAEAYHPQCSAISRYSIQRHEVENYDPASGDYYEDVVQEEGHAGIILAMMAIIIFILLSLFGCCLCCIPHHWQNHSNFISIFMTENRWWKRLLALLFVISVLAVAVIVMAMSIWGIVRLETDVRRVVPKAFDFMEDTEAQINSIYVNLTEAVDNGREVIDALQNTLREFQNDNQTRESIQRAGFDITETISDLENSIRDANETLDVVESEVNDNLQELLDGVRDAIGYRDEGEDINTAGRVGIIIAFVLFFLFALGSSIFSLNGTSSRCIMFWAAVMWLMLVIAFGFVGLLAVGKQVSRDSCLYIDFYAVQELRDVVNRDRIRIEDLLWYYFRPPRTGNRTLAELEELWSFPLTSVEDFLDFAQTEVFDENGVLQFPYTAAQPATRDALREVFPLVPQAAEDVNYVQSLIQGETFQTIHADFKDLICCSEYDAVDTVWTAWVVSSAFGMLLAVLMTLQGLIAIRLSSSPAVSLPVAKVPTVKKSAYMGPPVEEQRYPSSLPLTSTQANASSNVKYPEIQLPTRY